MRIDRQSEDMEAAGNRFFRGFFVWRLGLGGWDGDSAYASSLGYKCIYEGLQNFQM